MGVMGVPRFSLSFNYPRTTEKQWKAAASVGMVTVPTELLDAVIKLPESEGKFCWYLLSETYGKNDDWIERSLTQIAEGSGLPVTQVKPVMESLSSKELLILNSLP